MFLICGASNDSGFVVVFLVFPFLMVLASASDVTNLSLEDNDIAEWTQLDHLKSLNLHELVKKLKIFRCRSVVARVFLSKKKKTFFFRCRCFETIRSLLIRIIDRN